MTCPCLSLNTGHLLHLGVRGAHSIPGPSVATAILRCLTGGAGSRLHDKNWLNKALAMELLTATLLTGLDAPERVVSPCVVDANGYPKTHAQGGSGPKQLRSKMRAAILDRPRRRLTRWRHDRPAIHREGPPMGESPQLGRPLRRVGRAGFARNPLRGRPQDDRQGRKKGDRQGSAGQDARRPRHRQERVLAVGPTSRPTMEKPTDV